MGPRTAHGLARVKNPGLGQWVDVCTLLCALESNRLYIANYMSSTRSLQYWLELYPFTPSSIPLSLRQVLSSLLPFIADSVNHIFLDEGTLPSVAEKLRGRTFNLLTKMGSVTGRVWFFSYFSPPASRQPNWSLGFSVVNALFRFVR